MQRILVGTAIAVLFGSIAAYAAEPAPTTSPMAPSAAPTTTSAPMSDYAADCKELGTQWEAAETANASNTKLGKAKAKANSAEKNCASTKSAKNRKGIGQYKAALKMLGVKPTA